MRFAAVTDRGKVRSENEDAFLATGKIFAVADGMGGHLAGEVASATALKIFKDQIERGRGSTNKNLIVQSIQKANQTVYQKAIGEPGQQGMGTTLTAMILKNQKYLIGHIGDSRAYLLRKDKLRRLTEDHALVAEMVREGKISPEEAAGHPLRNVLTRALGVEPELEVDLIVQDQLAGDKILLCTDGLNAMLDDEQIERIIAREANPEDICQELIRTANAKGGSDNVTVVLVEFD